MRSRAPSRRHGRTLLIVLIAVLLALAFLAGWYFLQPSTQPAQDPGLAIATTFLESARSGHPEAAWESTTAEFKSASGREAFVKLARATPVLKVPVDYISTQTVTVLDQPRSEYLFRDPKSGATVRLVIGSEAGQWKVDRMLLN